MAGESSRTAVLGTGAWLQASSSAVSDLRMSTISTEGSVHGTTEVVKGTTEDKLITGGEETFDVLIVALMLEKGALDFYTKAQRLVKDEKAAPGLPETCCDGRYASAETVYAV